MTTQNAQVTLSDLYRKPIALLNTIVDAVRAYDERHVKDPNANQWQPTGDFRTDRGRLYASVAGSVALNTSIKGDPVHNEHLLSAVHSFAIGDIESALAHCGLNKEEIDKCELEAHYTCERIGLLPDSDNGYYYTEPLHATWKLYAKYEGIPSEFRCNVTGRPDQNAMAALVDWVTDIVADTDSGDDYA